MNQHSIAKAFMDQDDTWDFQFQPKQPTILWFDGPRGLAKNRDLKGFVEQEDIYGAWPGSVALMASKHSNLKQTLIAPIRETNRGQKDRQEGEKWIQIRVNFSSWNQKMFFWESGRAKPKEEEEEVRIGKDS